MSGASGQSTLPSSGELQLVAASEGPFFLLVKGALLLILVSRASLDKVLGAIPFSFFGLPFGAVINLTVIVGSAILCILTYPRCRHSVGPWWVLLLTFMIVSISYTPDKQEAARFVAMVATNVAMLAIPHALIHSEKQVKGYLFLVLLAAVIPVSMAPIVGGERFESTFPHPNIFAFFMVVVILVSAISLGWKEWRDDGVYRTLALLLILPCLFMLYRSGARGGWAALLGAGLLYAVLFDRRYIWFLALTPFALLVPEIQYRVLDVFRPVEYVGDGVQASSYAWRKFLWESAYSWFLEKPFIGYGIDSFSVYSPRFFPWEADGYNSHNVYVQLGFELGVIGLALWILIFLRLGVIAWNARPIAPEATALLIVLIAFYALICYSDNILYYLSFNWYYWFAVGVCSRWIQLRVQSEDLLRA
ncbi:O-antigen ligase family protein [Alsobacter sp. R-9]